MGVPLAEVELELAAAHCGVVCVGLLTADERGLSTPLVTSTSPGIKRKSL